MALRRLAVCFVVIGCESAPEVEHKTDVRLMIQAEAPPSEPASNEHGCDYDPIPIVNLSKAGLGVDGVFGTRSADPEVEVRNILEAKRELRARLGIPEQRDLLLQVEEDVSATDVLRFRALLRQMGYSNAEVVWRTKRTKLAR
jgi:hypothetical protein